MAAVRDLESYAQDQLAEEVVHCIDGFQDPDDLIYEIENLELDFDGDSYCPYYNQQDALISEHESEFGYDADDICGSKKYTASEWQQAQSAYAYAIGYIGFQHYISAGKTELTEAVTDFATDAVHELDYEDEDNTLKIGVSTKCPHGWAAHDHETDGGILVWKSKQLDGCNGAAIEINGVWLYCCVDPTKAIHAE
jgi:hypothetical protein